MNKHMYILLSLLIIVSCNYDTAEIPSRPQQQFDYIFLGHTYDWDNPMEVDPRIENIDFRYYNGIWLGGDVVATLMQESTVDYIDLIFNLSSEDTHWSMGNHDIRAGALPFIKSKTHKNDFYVSTKNNLTILVLNTALFGGAYVEDCDAQADQLELINHVLDTISISDHLVILSHYAMWGDVELGTKDVGTIANSDQRWQDILCDERSRFHEIIYPKLVDVKIQGIDVFVISGDGGQKNKGNSYMSEAGIHFIVSGINNSISYETAEQLNFNTQADSVLIFHQDLDLGTLDYEFIELNTL